MQDVQWFDVGAKGHHGYPQPENSWQSQTYSSHCMTCGTHGSQVGPYRFPRSNKVPHSHFRQLNWVFDAWFVVPEVEAILLSSGITGIDFGPAVDHKSGQPLDTLRQLIVTNFVEIVETSQLPTVTCKPFNEEDGTWADPSPVGPFCGAIKYHPPTSVVIPADALSTAGDLALTRTWFGSGGSANHLTVASRRFVELVRRYRWRGLEFSAVSHSGRSWRAA